MLCYRYFMYYRISVLCDEAQPHAAWARFEMNDLLEPKNKIGLGWLKTAMFRDWNSADWITLSLSPSRCDNSFISCCCSSVSIQFVALPILLCYFVSLWLCYTSHSLSLCWSAAAEFYSSESCFRLCTSCCCLLTTGSRNFVAQDFHFDALPYLVQTSQEASSMLIKTDI